MIMMYGIGGIGMTTMVPNALLMKALMGERKALAAGKISNKEWANILRTSQFSRILHWRHGNPFGRNYAQFTDSVKQPQVFAKYLRPKGSVRNNLRSASHDMIVNFMSRVSFLKRI